MLTYFTVSFNSFLLQLYNLIGIIANPYFYVNII